jgi:hypothetical protein|tara:strand:+ start:175 stop:357 length:183 start_codon:yes stop_codon:yes gene_type:complete
MKKEIVKQLLVDAGIYASDEDIDTTSDLYQALSDQLAKALPKSMESVEPHYIQPTRSDHP